MQYRVVVAPKRNLPAVAGVVLGLLAVVSYFALVLLHIPALTRFLEVPFVHFAALVAALLLSVAGVRGAYAAPPRYRGRVFAPVLGVVTFGLAMLFCLFIFVATAKLPAASTAPAVGSQAPDFALTDQSGHLVQLSSLRGHKTVLVFYRGFW